MINEHTQFFFVLFVPFVFFVLRFSPAQDYGFNTEVTESTEKEIRIWPGYTTIWAPASPASCLLRRRRGR
jgi:hypothetical protein